MMLNTQNLWILREDFIQIQINLKQDITCITIHSTELIGIETSHSIIYSMINNTMFTQVLDRFSNIKK